jgi:hypothetical protein
VPPPNEKPGAEEVGAGAAAVGADVKPPNPPKPEEAGAVAFGGAVRPSLRKDWYINLKETKTSNCLKTITKLTIVSEIQKNDLKSRRRSVINQPAKVL